MTITLPGDNGDFIKIKKGDKILYGGDQRLFDDERFRDKGCGAISAANIIAYKNITAGGKNPLIEFDEYMRLADELCKYIPADANGFALIKGIRKYSGIRLKYIPILFRSRDKMFAEISAAVEQGRPPILSVYCPHGFRINSVYSISDDIVPIKSYEVKGHYMTVTAVISNGGRRFLALSNWGRRFAVDFDVFYDHNRHMFRNGLGSCIGSGALIEDRN